MARVEMMLHITGGRADGSEWPHAGESLECGEQEARELVQGGMARWADETPAKPPAASVPAAAPPPPAPAATVTPTAEDGSEGDDEGDDPSKPRVRDPKEAWEQHAVDVHGVDVNTARSMTKSDLIAQYGAPPA